MGRTARLSEWGGMHFVQCLLFERRLWGSCGGTTWIGLSAGTTVQLPAVHHLQSAELPAVRIHHPREFPDATTAIGIWTQSAQPP